MFKFKLHINPYRRETHIEDLRYIDVSGITLVTKNAKFGMVGFASMVKRRQGQFHRVAGSVRYPELVPLPRGVTLTIRKFPVYPKLFAHDLVASGDISISDIVEY